MTQVVCKARRGIVAALAPLLLLVAPPARASSDGFGRHNEGAVMALGVASTGTIPAKLALFATSEGNRIDVPGYFRVDMQPQRVATDRPKLKEGGAYSNFGMHGGYMGLDLGPLCFGAGFGFDFYTVGVGTLPKPLPSGSQLLVAFGLEAAVGVRLFSWGRLLLTLQGDIASGSGFDGFGRRGVTADLMIGFGSSGVSLLLSGESGTFSNDKGVSFSGGQFTVGIGVGSNG